METLQGKICVENRASILNVFLFIGHINILLEKKQVTIIFYISCFQDLHCLGNIILRIARISEDGNTATFKI